ncbi:LysR family transcriptional regulator [Kineococcus glutinatus]|uniref:LysR family transcriptional regulator n=1 Tax=Kineococcus glutinatus TaxID=1070872 RepID=UPI0031EE0444
MAAGGVPPRALDPRRLLVFGEVGRSGSLSGAARVLGWTQPAVSQHVRRLERDVGVALIARRGRGIVLTAAGRVLLEHAEAVAARLAEAEAALADLAGLRTGRVGLAAFPSAAATFVAAAMTGLAEDHPGLDVVLDQLEPPQALEHLARGGCDVAVVFDHLDEPAVQDGGVVVPLLEEPLLLVLPPGHPLAGRAQVDVGELAAERWVAGCPRCRAHLVRTAAAAGFSPQVRHSTDDYVVVQSMVASGGAVALLPSLALAASRHPAVVVRPPAVPVTRAVSARLAAESAQLPAVRALLAQLRRAAAPHRAP